MRMGFSLYSMYWVQGGKLNVCCHLESVFFLIAGKRQLTDLSTFLDLENPIHFYV